MNIIKVFVAGTFSSGKTSFIQHLSEIDVVTAELSSSAGNNKIACDFGRITLGDDTFLFLFGAPGSRRLDFTLPYFDDLFGMICVLDSAPYSLASLREAEFILRHYFMFRDMPIVVAANKQDKPDAWSPDDLRIACRIPDDVPIIPCSAKAGEGVKESMLTLCDIYLERLKTE